MVWLAFREQNPMAGFDEKDKAVAKARMRFLTAIS
jgi:hypothetical protein